MWSQIGPKMTILAKNNSFYSCKIKRVETGKVHMKCQMKTDFTATKPNRREMSILDQKHRFRCCKM